MRRLIHILIIFGAIYIGACTYSSDEIYYMEPVAGDSTSINAYSSLDTIDLTDPIDNLEVTYSAEVDKGALYYVGATLEDLIIYDTIFQVDRDTLTGPYTIEDSFIIPEDLPMDSGEYQLDIAFLYSSNTNSMADYFGYEYYGKYLNYTVTIYGGGK